GCRVGEIYAQRCQGSRLAPFAKQFPTITVRRTPRCRFDLQPVARRARAVSRIAPLRDDALKTHLMAGTEQLHRIIEVARELQMFAVGLRGKCCPHYLWRG